MYGTKGLEQEVNKSRLAQNTIQYLFTNQSMYSEEVCIKRMRRRVIQAKLGKPGPSMAKGWCWRHFSKYDYDKIVIVDPM